ncbi:MAG TPA: nucleotidyltransferase family protein [Rubrivivax sp.]|nr:nucleotidyltransferase family protein [Rubrivivax sp.]
MKALILAAGRGERMRPLTDTCPKPLLPLRGQPLIAWHLRALARAGVREVVINTAWLEEQFPQALGDGSRWGLRIRYSTEGRDHAGALETAGGIRKALPWLAPRGDEAFWVVSGDIFMPGFEFDAALARDFAAGSDLGMLWLVPNPEFHAGGDFELDAGRLRRGDPRRWTYANVALLRPALVAALPPGQRAALGPLLFEAAAADRLAGRVLQGEWHNLGTPAQLAALNAALSVEGR